MKHIIKGNEPPLFIEWKNLENEDWQPTYDDLCGEEKQAVVESLIDEQGGICCYCECKLNPNDSHIEHIVPQKGPSGNMALSLTYDNIICSCQSNLKKGTPLTCGNAKGNWYDVDLLISPLNADCEDYFVYLGDGQILPVDQDKKAIETIKRLKLDDSSLTSKREKAIEPFLSDELDEQDLITFVQGYLQKNQDASFNEFWTTINYLFGQVLTYEQ